MSFMIKITASQCANVAHTHLQNEKYISTKQSIEQIQYPKGICGTGLCHLRALVNVWGKAKVTAVLGNEQSLHHNNLDAAVVNSIFQEHNNKKDHFIYFIYGIHWVALTPK